jgi:hypothetical protein
MTKHDAVFLILLGVAVAGCMTGLEETDADVRAWRHMLIADSLEHALAFSEAEFEYGLVMEHYISSRHYPSAIWRTALLHLRPDNPRRNDSTARYWLTTYRDESSSAEDRNIAHLLVFMLDRLDTLRSQLSRQTALTDSLSVITRSGSAELVARRKRIQELETELKQANDEVKRLREVDVRLHETRVRK